MPTVLVTGPSVTLNLPFSSPAVAVTIAGTHFDYNPRRDDQAELATGGLVKYRDGIPANGHPS